MKRKLCEACKSHGQYNSGDHLDAIYRTHGAPTIVRLCYAHSVELFKFGQRSFISKYRSEVEYENELVKGDHDPLKNYFVFNSFR